MAKTISIKDFKIGFNFHKAEKKNQASLLKTEKELQSELNYQIVKKEREAHVRTFHMLN